MYGSRVHVAPQLINSNRGDSFEHTLDTLNRPVLVMDFQEQGFCDRPDLTSPRRRCEGKYNPARMALVP